MTDFEWDHEKNRINIRKRGLDFEEAISIFDGDTVEVIDDRLDYGEERIIATGEMDGTVIVVVYTLRGETIHIISARKAERYERVAYYQTVTGRAPDG